MLKMLALNDQNAREILNITDFFPITPIAVIVRSHPINAPDRQAERLSSYGFLSSALSSKRTILSFTNAILACRNNIVISQCSV
jgi:hypothetical protein